jgi:RNA polymerase sigma-70 factor (ECF subfamily)
MNALAAIDSMYIGYVEGGESYPTREHKPTSNHTDFRVAPPADRQELKGWGDDILMQQIARGDTQAFEELYDRYVRGCFGLAMKIVREPTVAEEVVQDVFMKLWSRPGIFSSERGKFSGWLLTLVHNRSVDKLRRLKAGAAGPVLPLDGTLDAGLNLADVLADTAATPYDQAWTEEQGRIVREAIKSLPHHQREAIVLAYFGGLTQKEIAERLQEPLGTVKTRTRAALQQLRRSLAGGGLMGEAL